MVQPQPAPEDPTPEDDLFRHLVESLLREEAQRLRRLDRSLFADLPAPAQQRHGAEVTGRRSVPLERLEHRPTMIWWALALLTALALAAEQRSWRARRSAQGLEQTEPSCCAARPGAQAVPACPCLEDGCPGGCARRLGRSGAGGGPPAPRPAPQVPGHRGSPAPLRQDAVGPSPSPGGVGR